MKAMNIKEAKGWFEILQTSERSQTAMMMLAPGKSSGERPRRMKKAIRFY
jgi:hypothetical protein